MARPKGSKDKKPRKVSKNPKPKVQFCPQGHNTFICGRNKRGSCEECHRILSSEYYFNNPDKIEKYRKENEEAIKLLAAKWREEHVEERKKYQEEYYIINKDKINAQNRKWMEEHKKEIKEWAKKYREEHKEELSDYLKRYYEEHREQIIEQQKKYAKEHSEIVKLAALRSHIKRGLRVPQWGQEGILEFYIDCPKNKEVDHYIPLCGRKVSGLDVIWNLQYLTHFLNIKKGNRIDLLEASDWYGKLLEKAGLK